MQKIINEAIKAIEAGDKKLAHGLLLGVIQEEPDNVVAWLWMAEVYSDPKNKKDCYLRALQIDPGNQIARAHMKAIRYQESLAAIEMSVDQTIFQNLPIQQARTIASPKKKTSPALGIFIALLVIGIIASASYFFLYKPGYLDRFFAKATEETVLNGGLDIVEIEESGQVPAPTSTTVPVETDEVPEPTTTSEPIIFVPTMPSPDPDNLIQNGYFLDEFQHWTREILDEGGSSKIAIEDSTNSPFNRALKMSQEGLGNLAFTQLIKVPSTDLSFSCKLYTKATEGLIFGFSGTGYSIVLLSYKDANQKMLGMTRILNVNESIFAGTAFVGAPDEVSDSNTVHNIRINSDDQNDIAIDISQEITYNLLGININDVEYIELVLLVGSNDKDATAMLKVSDILLKEK